MRHQRTRSAKPSQAGISLLEVLMAVSILGICFTAIFSSFSAGLGAIERVNQYNRVVALATEKLNEFLLDPALRAGQEKSGPAEAGLRWRATAERVEERPGPAPDRPVELLRVSVEVSWVSRSGRQSFLLETLKLQVAEAEAP